MASRDTALTTELRKLGQALGWEFPFFLLPLARLRWIEDDSPNTPTASMDAAGRFRGNPGFIGRLSKDEKKGLIAHEIMHLLLDHFYRRDGRDPKVWNIACDMAINHGLRTCGIKLPAGGIYPPATWEALNAEQIYEQLMQDPSQQPQGGGDGAKGDGPPTPTGGCGLLPPQPGEGDGEGDGDDDQDGDGPGKGESEGEIRRKWREVAASAKEMQRQQGEGPGNALIGLLDVPPARVKWASVLRNGMTAAISAHGRDTQTWTRRGRRSQAIGPQFAGWITNAAKCAVVIDTSGSMGHDVIMRCIGETIGICKTSGVAVFLAVHDAKVHWSGWISPTSTAASLEQYVIGGGGTCAHEAYNHVGTAAKRFDAMIHLTDGYLHWPEWPANVRRPIVALVGYCSDESTVKPGATIIPVPAE